MQRYPQIYWNSEHSRFFPRELLVRFITKIPIPEQNIYDQIPMRQENIRMLVIFNPQKITVIIIIVFFSASRIVSWMKI